MRFPSTVTNVVEEDVCPIMWRYRKVLLLLFWSLRSSELEKWYRSIENLTTWEEEIRKRAAKILHLPLATFKNHGHRAVCVLLYCAGRMILENRVEMTWCGFFHSDYSFKSSMVHEQGSLLQSEMIFCEIGLLYALGISQDILKEYRNIVRTVLNGQTSFTYTIYFFLSFQ